MGADIESWWRQAEFTAKIQCNQYGRLETNHSPDTKGAHRKRSRRTISEFIFENARRDGGV